MSKSHLSVVPSHISKPTTSITVQGLTVPISAPYAEGHTCSSAEASSLNQTRAENLRNNFASRIKKALAEAPAHELSPELAETLTAEFAAYEAEYKFAAKRPSKASVSALQRECNKIAKGMILEALRKADTDPKTVSPERMSDLIAALLTKRPDIADEAQRRVSSTQSLAADALASLSS